MLAWQGCMVIATSLFAFFGSRCFESVQVTTDLEALGDRLDAAAGKVTTTTTTTTPPRTFFQAVISS